MAYQQHGNTRHGPEVVAEIRKLWDEGLTYREIAARLSLTKGQVAGIALRNDFPMRRRKEAA